MASLVFMIQATRSFDPLVTGQIDGDMHQALSIKPLSRQDEEALIADCSGLNSANLCYIGSGMGKSIDNIGFGASSRVSTAENEIDEIRCFHVSRLYATLGTQVQVRVCVAGC
jgi:hypothetical protein